MKKFALAVFAVLVVGAVVYAETDAEPWESVYKQRDYKKPQRFSREIYTDYPLQAAFLDAGTIRVGNLNSTSNVRAPFLDAGTVLVDTALRLSGSAKASLPNNFQTCNLDGGSPAQCELAVTAGAKCICSPVGLTATIAGNGCSVSLTSTKLTVSGPNSAAYDVNTVCDK